MQVGLVITLLALSLNGLPHLKGCKTVRVEIVLDDSTHRDIYQGWFDRCAKPKI